MTDQSGKEGPVEALEGKRPPIETKKCTDCFFVVLFFLFWIGMLIVMTVGLATGDINRLLFGIDYLGNPCGTCQDSKSCGYNIFYPRPALDALLQGFNPLTGLFPSSQSSIHYFGICVDSCPQPGEFVCTYEAESVISTQYSSSQSRLKFLSSCNKMMVLNSRGAANNFGMDALSPDCLHAMENCWRVTQEQTSLFFRCIPIQQLNTTTESQCYYPAFQDAASTISMPTTVCEDQLNSEYLDISCSNSACKERTGKICIKNPRCSYLLEKDITFSVKNQYFSTTELLAGKLGTWTQSISRSTADLQHTWWTILLTGGLGACILGFLWIFILEFMVGLFVWVMILLSILLLVLSAVLCFAKSGRLQDEMVWLSSQIDNQNVVNAFTTSNGAGAIWYILGIGLSILSCIYFLILLVMRRKIKLAIRILQEASKAVEKLPSIMLMPAFTNSLTILLGIYGVTIFGYVYTAGSISAQNITISNLADTITNWEEIMTTQASQTSVSTRDGRTLLPSDYPMIDIDAVQQVRKMLEVNATTIYRNGILTVVENTSVGLLLVYHIFGCLWTLQVIHGIAFLTISRSVSKWYWTADKSTLPFIPLVSSFWSSITINLGTVCLGALLIATMQMLRTLLYYISKYTTKVQDKNSIVRTIMRILQYCLMCFEKFLRYVTHNAFIMSGMFGCGFCSGAGLAVSYVLKNLARIGAVHFVTKFIQLLSVLVITAGCGVLEYVWLENAERFQLEGESQITSSSLSVFLVILLSFFISQSFMQIYGVAVDTILLCFCVDVEYNRESGNYFMGKSLKRFFSRKNRTRANPSKKNAPTVVIPS